MNLYVMFHAIRWGLSASCLNLENERTTCAPATRRHACWLRGLAPPPAVKAWSLLNSNWVAEEDYWRRQRPCHSAHAPGEGGSAKSLRQRHRKVTGIKRWFNERDEEGERRNFLKGPHKQE